jgi:hypothetical protein
MPLDENDAIGCVVCIVLMLAILGLYQFGQIVDWIITHVKIEW